MAEALSSSLSANAAVADFAIARLRRKVLKFERGGNVSGKPLAAAAAAWLASLRRDSLRRVAALVAPASLDVCGALARQCRMPSRQNCKTRKQLVNGVDAAEACFPFMRPKFRSLRRNANWAFLKDDLRLLDEA